MILLFLMLLVVVPTWSIPLEECKQLGCKNGYECFEFGAGAGCYKTCSSNADCPVGQTCRQQDENICECSVNSNFENNGCSGVQEACVANESGPNSCVKSNSYNSVLETSVTCIENKECSSLNCNSNRCECKYNSDCGNGYSCFRDPSGAENVCKPIGNALFLGSSLQVGQSLRSLNGNFTARIKEDGNLVITDHHNIEMWNSETTGDSKQNYLVLQDNGDLVIYDSTNTSVWSSKTVNRGKYVMLQNDGNLVLFGPNSAKNGNKKFWSSNYQNHGDVLEMGKALEVGQELVSQESSYIARLQYDGRFVVYDKNLIKKWSPYQNGQLATRLVLQNTGNLVLFDADDNTIWSSNSENSSFTGYYLIIQNDGNLVIYDKDVKPHWSFFQSIENTLKGGEKLNFNQDLTSKNLKYRASFRSDGDFVVTNFRGVVNWRSKTDGKGSFLQLQRDGNLEIIDANNQPVWTSDTKANETDSSYFLILQDDGNLVIYGKNNTPIWSLHQISDGDVLQMGETLTKGQALKSKNFLYTAKITDKGAFAVLDENDAIIWSSNSSIRSENLLLQENGNLVIFDRKNLPTWSSNTANSASTGFFLVMQNDGNLVLYDNDRKPLWSTGAPKVPDQKS